MSVSEGSGQETKNTVMGVKCFRPGHCSSENDHHSDVSLTDSISAVKWAKISVFQPP